MTTPLTGSQVKRIGSFLQELTVLSRNSGVWIQDYGSAYLKVDDVEMVANLSRVEDNYVFEQRPS